MVFCVRFLGSCAEIFNFQNAESEQSALPVFQSHEDISKFGVRRKITTILYEFQHYF